LEKEILLIHEKKPEDEADIIAKTRAYLQASRTANASQT